MSKQELLDRLYALDRQNRHWAHISALLQWDQETYLPPSGVDDRSEQLALLEARLHEGQTSPELGRFLGDLGSTVENPLGDETLPPVDRNFLRVLRKSYDRAACLPAELVAAAAKAEALSQAAWVQARKQKDFSFFAPHLQTMIDFAKQKARLWGFKELPYNGLLDLHESGMTVDTIDRVFTPLRQELTALTRKIAARPPVERDFLDREYPVDRQDHFGRDLMKALGFEIPRGRLDLSAHPFTTTLGSDDIRITTRYFPKNILSGLFSIIHETGHALYELGFDPKLRGTSLADGASMGIHESQSRLWENVIGRSLPFWEGLFPLLQGRFSEQLKDVSAQEFYRGVNDVRPSLIRVDADEVTYSLHIILRYELEKRLFSGELSVADLPQAWNVLMLELLGLEPETDAEGVLQDVHWSMGAFGYFPSYALGNLYGLQMWETLKDDIPDIDDHLRSGRFDVPLGWLRDRVHRLGARLLPLELMEAVTGKAPDSRAFIGYLTKKYSSLYDL
jgi:carboxypeptidase Taq